MLTSEQIISLSQAARLLPGEKGASRKNPSTLFRWVTKGCRTLDGRTVRLEALRIGGRLFTSHEALDRFIAELNASTDPVPAPRSPSERRRASDRAAAQLEKMGA